MVLLVPAQLIPVLGATVVAVMVTVKLLLVGREAPVAVQVIVKVAGFVTAYTTRQVRQATQRMS